MTEEELKSIRERADQYEFVSRDEVLGLITEIERLKEENKLLRQAHQSIKTYLKRDE